ncbi:MAG: hypothetical protein WDW36_005168 [Sanguina aurantia]
MPIVNHGMLCYLPAACTYGQFDIALPIDGALVTAISTKLGECSQIVTEAGEGIVPWTIKRNRKSAARAAQQLGLLATDARSSLEATLVYVCRVVGEAQDAHLAVKEQLEERAKLAATLGVAAMDAAAKDEKIDSMTGKLSEARTLRTQQAEQVSEMTTNEDCAKEKASLVKRVKELVDKQRDHDDVQGRENRRLASELKKALAGKEAALSTMRNEATVQLNDMHKETKHLQHRYSSLKLALEASRACQVNAETATEVAVLALSKSQEELTSMRNKLGHARSARAEMSMQLQATAEELVMMRTELDAAGMACKMDVRYLNKALPFPRSAFTTHHGGIFLHSRACGVPLDTTRVVPVTYSDHHELAAHLLAEGLHLCHFCRQEPGF